MSKGRNTPGPDFGHLTVDVLFHRFPVCPTNAIYTNTFHCGFRFATFCHMWYVPHQPRDTQTYIIYSLHSKICIHFHSYCPVTNVTLILLIFHINMLAFLWQYKMHKSPGLNMSLHASFHQTALFPRAAKDRIAWPLNLHTRQPPIMHLDLAT